MYEVELRQSDGHVLVVLVYDRSCTRSQLRAVWSPQIEEAVVRKDSVEVYRWERACPACRSGSEHVDGCPFDTTWCA